MEKLNKYIILGVIGLVVEIFVLSFAPEPKYEETYEETFMAKREIETLPAGYAESTAEEKTKIQGTETECENKYYSIPVDKELQSYIFDVSEVYGVDHKIIFGVIHQESRFQPNVIGDGGEAFGLMQIQPKWHEKRIEKLGGGDLLNPYVNILVGTDILSELFQKYGMIDGLTYYRWGTPDGDKTYAEEVISFSNTLKLEG